MVTFILQGLLCVVCVILNVFRVMTFFLYRGGKKETFQHMCVWVHKQQGIGEYRKYVRSLIFIFMCTCHFM